MITKRFQEYKLLIDTYQECELLISTYGKDLFNRISLLSETSTYSIRECTEYALMPNDDEEIKQSFEMAAKYNLSPECYLDLKNKRISGTLLRRIR